jgi:hypothetical protein
MTHLCYHDTTQGVGDGGVNADEVELEGGRSETLQRDDKVLLDQSAARCYRPVVPTFLNFSRFQE